METTDDPGVQRFYHGTKADLRPGDLIEPGYASNFGTGKRSAYVYLTATLEAATWGAQLARGDGPGRVYIVEPTGPMVDDPDLTDKKFPGNPTKSYCSREPLRVVGELTDWQPHPAEALKAMTDALEQLARAHEALVASIPTEVDVEHAHARSEELAREWAGDAAYVGCTLLMLIRAPDASVSWALEYHSPSLGETHVVHLPEGSGPQPQHDVPMSGRLTDVTAWREGWGAVLESCATEIGLASETKVLVTVDAEHDALTFDVDAAGPQRSWHRELRLACGVLSDRERGEIWYFEAASS